MPRRKHHARNRPVARLPIQLWSPLLCLVAVCIAANLQADEQPAQPDNAPSAAEQEIRAHAQRFAKAFDQGDAKAVAATFATNATVSIDGEMIAEGRAAIEQAYAKFFQQNPGAKIVIKIESIRMVGLNLAIESGSSQVVAAGKPSPVIDAYKVVHTRSDGAWLTATSEIRQRPAAESTDWKQQLAYFEGQWIAESQGSQIEMSCEWMAGGNFMRRTFRVASEGKLVSSGVQIVGWDAQRGSVTSWEFSSDGGSGRGWWTQDQDQWVLATQATTLSGEQIESTNIITPLGKDQFRWQSTKRSVNGVALEDTESIRVRRAPQTGSPGKEQ